MAATYHLSLHSACGANLYFLLRWNPSALTPPNYAAQAEPFSTMSNVAVPTSFLIEYSSGFYLLVCFAEKSGLNFEIPLHHFPGSSPVHWPSTPLDTKPSRHVKSSTKGKEETQILLATTQFYFAIAILVLALAHYW
jgi:hypothetical protein